MLGTGKESITESAENAREKKCSTAWGAAGRDSFQPFRKQSLQLGELEARLLQPCIPVSSGSQVPGRGRSRSAKTDTFCRRRSRVRDLAAHTRLPMADHGDPRGWHSPFPGQLPVPCMQGVLKIIFFPA